MSDVKRDEDGKVHIDAKTARFDRQLRMWGGHGQQALSESHICCLGSGATAADFLKNMVLPDVGRVTIVDDTVITLSDRGNNFFIRADDVGQDRATAIARNLNVLNPPMPPFREHEICSVDNQNPQDLVTNNIEYFSGFSLIVSACILSESANRALAAHCFSNNIPFIYVKCNGLLGHIRLQVPEITIVESHDDADRTDVYISPQQVANWPEYEKWLDSFDMDSMDDHGHKHVPYVAIIHKEMKKWVAEHGSPPKKFAERKAFKAQIRADSRNFFAEENYGEACINAHRACSLPSLDPSTSAVYQDEKASTLSDPTPFWICVRALNDWKANEGNGVMPVSNDVPDMSSNTSTYIALKAVFAEKAASDLAAIRARVNDLAAQHNVTVDADFVTRFVKNCRFLGLQRTTPIENEYDAKTFALEDVNEVFEDYYEFDKKDRPIDMNWYFAFRAGEAFREANGRYAGVTDDTCEADTAALTKIGQDLASSLGVTATLDTRCFQEYVRYGNVETHNTAAMLAGIMSQIALKVLIKQFIPMNNTLIVNGIHMSVSTYKM